MGQAFQCSENLGRVSSWNTEELRRRMRTSTSASTPRRAFAFASKRTLLSIIFIATISPLTLSLARKTLEKVPLDGRHKMSGGGPRERTFQAGAAGASSAPRQQRPSLAAALAAGRAWGTRQPAKTQLVCPVVACLLWSRRGSACERFYKQNDARDDDG